MTSLRLNAPKRSSATLLHSRRPLVLGTLGMLIILGIWEIASRAFRVSAAYMPAPSEIIRTVIELLSGEAFWSALGQTMLSTGIGLIASFILAVTLGVIYGTFVFVQDSTFVLIELLRPIPPVALLPVGLLFFGTGLEMKLSLIIYTAFWPVFIQTTYAMRDIDPTLLDMTRIHRVPLVRRLRGIVLPSIAPYLVIGLRLAVVGALVASIVTELIGGAAGLGYMLGIAQNTGNSERMYGLVVLIGFLGLAVNILFGILERRVMSWNPAVRSQA